MDMSNLSLRFGDLDARLHVPPVRVRDRNVPPLVLLLTARSRSIWTNEISGLWG